MIKNENIDILLDSFFEVYFLCRFAEQEVFESEYQETEYLLLDNLSFCLFKNFFFVRNLFALQSDSKELKDFNVLNVLKVFKLLRFYTWINNKKRPKKLYLNLRPKGFMILKL